MLTQSIGDSKIHEVDLTWEDAPFTPGVTWGLIFTAKRKVTDPDASSVIQKASGVGLSVVGSTGSIAIVGADSDSLLATIALVCDIRAQHVTTGERRVVWQDKIKFLRPVTQETTTSVPIYTTEEPAPFGGGVTLAAVLTALGVPTYANLAAANAGIGAIGRAYYDTALATINITTANS